MIPLMVWLVLLFALGHRVPTSGQQPVYASSAPWRYWAVASTGRAEDGTPKLPSLKYFTP